MKFREVRLIGDVLQIDDLAEMRIDEQLCLNDPFIDV